MTQLPRGFQTTELDVQPARNYDEKSLLNIPGDSGYLSANKKNLFNRIYPAYYKKLNI